MFDHTFPLPCEDVKSTEPPSQNVVGPPVVIVGVEGSAFTVTTIGAEVDEHPDPSVYVTEIVCDVVTVIVCEVSVVDQLLFDPYEEVKSTDPPSQNVIAPLGVIVGVVGGLGS